MRWLLRKLGHGLPALPTVSGRALATRVAGLLLVGGAILIVVTVALPPAAEGSDLLILGYGAVAAVAGVWLLSTRRASEPVLGGAAALGAGVLGGDLCGLRLVVPEAGALHLPLEALDLRGQGIRVKGNPRAASAAPGSPPSVRRCPPSEVSRP